MHNQNDAILIHYKEDASVPVSQNYFCDEEISVLKILITFFNPSTTKDVCLRFSNFL